MHVRLTPSAQGSSVFCLEKVQDSGQGLALRHVATCCDLDGQQTAASAPGREELANDFGVTVCAMCESGMRSDKSQRRLRGAGRGDFNRVQSDRWLSLLDAKRTRLLPAWYLLVEAEYCIRLYQGSCQSGSVNQPRQQAGVGWSCQGHFFGTSSEHAGQSLRLLLAMTVTLLTFPTVKEACPCRPAAIRASFWLG